MIWSVTTVALLLVLCLQSQKTCSFAPQSETRRSGRVFNALPIAVNNQDQQTVPEISDSLVQLLVLPSNDKDEKKKDLIQSLAKQLIDAQVSFDPTQCVNDKSLYFSNVLDGPSPLWERLGFASNNIQGQQYTYRDDEKSVINYAEIFGSGKSTQMWKCNIYLDSASHLTLYFSLYIRLRPSFTSIWDL